jgi:hypothetical protein
MRYWLCAIGGTVLAGGYGFAKLADKLGATRDVALQAWGAISAYALVGAMFGAVIAFIFFPGKSATR